MCSSFRQCNMDAGEKYGLTLLGVHELLKQLACDIIGIVGYTQMHIFRCHRKARRRNHEEIWKFLEPNDWFNRIVLDLDELEYKR